MSETTLDVLVVEPDVIIRKSIGSLLSRAFPCRVDASSDMEGALRLVENKPPYRLVILEPYGLARDLAEPRRLIEAVSRRQTEERRTPIVILSVLSLDELREDYGISEGDFDLYMGKPVTRELTDGVRMYLENPAP